MTIKSSIYTTPYVDFHICIYNSCLLFSGADVNEINNAGKSALLIALEDGKFDIAEYLIKHGGDVNTVDHLGQSALFLTMNNNTDHKCIKLLKKLIKAGKVLVSFFFIKFDDKVFDIHLQWAFTFKHLLYFICIHFSRLLIRKRQVLAEGRWFWIFTLFLW